MVSGKEPTCQCRRFRRCGVDPWVKESLWRRKWQPSPVILPEISHGQRSLVDLSLWCHKESDTTEDTYTYSLKNRVFYNIKTNSSPQTSNLIISPPTEGITFKSLIHFFLVFITMSFNNMLILLLVLLFGSIIYWPLSKEDEGLTLISTNQMHTLLYPLFTQ